MNIELSAPVWSQSDYDKGWCSSWHVGTKVDSSKWSGRDYMEGRCGAADIDSPKLVGLQGGDPGFQNAPDVLSNAQGLHSKLNRVREGILDWICDYPGGPKKFCTDHPGLAGKMATRLMGGTPPTPVPSMPIIDIPWLTANRLAYKRDNVVDATPLLRQDIIDDLIPDSHLQGG